MSAEATVAFFGIRIETSGSEMDLLQERRHPMMLSARAAGLHHYWANFGGESEKYYLFVGYKLGVLGVENSNGLEYGASKLEEIMGDTRQKLILAGIEQEPSLWMEWMPDT